MELERAFTFIWEDQGWPKKIGIAALLAVSLIGMVAIVGWGSELARRVAHDEPDTLPEWHDLGKYFINGLKFIGVLFVWSLPVILLILLYAVLMVFSFSEQDISTLQGILAFSSVCIFIFVFIYILVINLLAIPLWEYLAEEVPFRELLRPTRSWQLIRANGGGYILTILAGWLVTGIMALLGAAACLVGALFTAVASQLIFAHLVGQATAQAKANLDNQAAVQPM